MSIKSIIKSSDAFVSRCSRSVDKATFRAQIKILGLKEGNIYAPSWEPKNWSRIICIEYPYVIYVGMYPVDGGHTQGGTTCQSNVYGFWIEHEFVKHHPLTEWDKMIRDQHRSVSSVLS